MKINHLRFQKSFQVSDYDLLRFQLTYFRPVEPHAKLYIYICSIELKGSSFISNYIKKSEFRFHYKEKLIISGSSLRSSPVPENCLLRFQLTTFRRAEPPASKPPWWAARRCSDDTRRRRGRPRAAGCGTELRDEQNNIYKWWELYNMHISTT